MTLKEYWTSDFVPTERRWVYVRRNEHLKIIQGLDHADRRPLITVRGCRQTGKSSLIRHQILPKLEGLGWSTRFSDLRMLELEDPDLTVSFAISRLFHDETRPDPMVLRWREEFGIRERGSEPGNVMSALSSLLSRLVKNNQGKKLAIVLEELDALHVRAGAIGLLLFSIGAAWDSAADIRGRLVFITNTRLDILDMLADTNFTYHSKIGNLTLPVVLGDFRSSKSTIHDLGAGLPQSAFRDKIIENVLRETWGQPQLTNMLLDRIQKVPLEKVKELGVADLVSRQVDDLLRRAARTSQEYFHFQYAEDHLRLSARSDIDASESPVSALEYFKTVKRDFPNAALNKPDRPRAGRLLESVGLVVQRKGSYVVRSPIYNRHYTDEWIESCSKELVADQMQVRRASTPVTLVKESLPFIGLLNCGGTLGMQRLSGTTAREPADLEGYLKSFSPIDKIGRLLIVGGTPIRDSADMGPDDWDVIAARIFETWKTFEGTATPLAGFVVAFGTDTLAHAAMGVALALGPALPVPVVFTGAQALASIHHGDASANLARAAAVVAKFGAVGRRKPILPEVLVIFDDQLFRGVRVEKRHDAEFQGFHAPGYGPIGAIKEKLRLRRGYRPKGGNHQSVENFKPTPGFDRRVLLVSQYPGMLPSYFESLLARTENFIRRYGAAELSKSQKKAPDLVRAIVIESLGVGNIPTRAGLSLLRFIKKAVSMDIPVAVTARIPIETELVTSFGPASAAKHEGAMIVGSMTTAAVLTKTMWLLHQADEGRGRTDGESVASYVRRNLEVDLVGETGDASPLQRRRFSRDSK